MSSDLFTRADDLLAIVESVADLKIRSDAEAHLILGLAEALAEMRAECVRRIDPHVLADLASNESVKRFGCGLNVMSLHRDSPWWFVTDVATKKIIGGEHRTWAAAIQAARRVLDGNH